MKELYLQDRSYANMRARLPLLRRVRLQALNGQSVSQRSLLFPALPSLHHLYAHCIRVYYARIGYSPCCIAGASRGQGFLET